MLVYPQPTTFFDMHLKKSLYFSPGFDNFGPTGILSEICLIEDSRFQLQNPAMVR
jgi:hypothetical protein